jgi:hypothetical protein
MKMPARDRKMFRLIKYYPPWRSSMAPGKSTLSEGMPWITYDAISFLKKKLTKDMRVFEYGSGGSSVFFSCRTSEVISVEHDERWLERVKQYIDSREITNWKGILALPTKKAEPLPDSSDPGGFSSSDKNFLGYSFETYVKSIDAYPDNYFDLIIVDGRARPSCIRRSVSKLKKNGYMLVDNADRANYQRAIDEYMTEGFSTEVDSFSPTAYSSEFTKTLIRKKII